LIHKRKTCKFGAERRLNAWTDRQLRCMP